MVAQRDGKGRFIKGESGNPGGRTAGDFTISGLIDEAVSRDDWMKIIGILKTRAMRGDVKAVEMLMDRRFGKPLQKNENENTGDLRILVEYADANG